MHLRRALPAAVTLSGSIAVVGAVFLFAVKSPPGPQAPAAMATGSAAAKAESPATAAADSPSPLAAAVSGLTAAADADHASVAVENLATGATTSYNVGDDYATASIVKLDILCTLLYQDQLSGHSPSSSEQSLIKTMIENSDNDAAQHLFEDEGGTPAITKANEVFGLSDTTVQKSGTVDEAGYSWGDTTTSAPDQLQLLRQVFTTSSVLTPANRGYIESLLEKVETDQRWGVSAAANDPSPSASDYMLKNGWLSRGTTHLWEINSIGEVQHDGKTYLVAVLSDGNKTMDSGIGVVQQLAKEAVDAQT